MPFPTFVSITEKIQRRRTFAIISHPGADKTTLTEKLLRYGGQHGCGPCRWPVQPGAPQYPQPQPATLRDHGA